jgi:electron transfer flavoprotein beta subunit
VAVKQTPDPNAIRFDSSGAFAASTPRVVNEYDGYALEEAIRTKEAGKADEVVVVSVGPVSARDAIQRGLAMGADRGILVQASDSDLTSMKVASIIATEARDGGYDMIFVGQETSDSGTGNVGPQLAAMLDYPLISNVVGFEADGNAITLQREVEDGRHIVEVNPPAVICALTGLNEPRSPSLKGIMAARKKPIEEKSIVGYETPETRTEWGQLYPEQREVQATIIQGDDPEAAAKQVVEMLREKKLI